jgi:hypothetical protein
MGSQAVHDAMAVAPPVIVVQVSRDRWRLAELTDARHVDMSYGGMGPVTISYKARARRYHTSDAARKAADRFMRARA